MSPFQRDVIQTTLEDFDIQAQKGLGKIGQAAIGAGAFGGGREGVAEAEYQAASDRNRAALQAQLLQQGFGQAQQQAGLDFARQMNLAQQAPALAGQQIAGLSTLGAQQQAQAQAGLTAQQQLAQQQLQQPLTAAQTYGTGVTSLIAGYPGTTQQTSQPGPSPISTALGIGSTLAGIYRAVAPQQLKIIYMKIFKRPMFRKGGEVGGGIMTGLRENYSDGSARERLARVVAQYPSTAVDPLSQFLIQGGLNLVSGPASGGGVLADAAKLLKNPLQVYLKV